MEEDWFLTDILLDRHHGSVAGGTEDNFNIPITQGITSDVGVRSGWSSDGTMARSATGGTATGCEAAVVDPERIEAQEGGLNWDFFKFL